MENQKISLEYEGEWKIDTPDNPTSFKNIATPAFSPLPDSSVTFCFEAFYQSIKHESTNNRVSLFKLKLVKLSSLQISPTLTVIIRVKVNYLDGSLFKDYQTLSPETVDTMKEITFEDAIRDLYVIGIGNTFHYSKMLNKSSMIIKCKMVFYDQNSASHITPGIERLSSDKFFDSVANFKQTYDSDMFSDFVFHVGDKSFPAHKFLLAVHSPVFKNMLTHEFLESENNSATITDTTPEIFHMFLKFLYSGEIEEKSWDSIKALYYLADKYDVKALKKECADATISFLSVDLVCEILQIGYSYSDTGLKTAAINYAVNHMKEIVSRNDWQELVEANSKIGYEVAVNFIPR